MRKKLIKKLAEQSYSEKKLDKKRVFSFAKVLKRVDLREYIRNLRNFESRMTVTVTLPNTLGIREIREKLIKIYPYKKIIFKIDPGLVAGVRVVDYDNVYELSLENSLETTLDKITYQND